MSKSIRLSRKHGVNPSVGVCFWCGKDDGSVLLMGRLPNDAEAPRRACAGYDPCPDCKAQFDQPDCVVFIEADTAPTFDGQPPMQRKPFEVYPTGRLFGIAVDAATRLLQPGELRDDTLRRRRAFMDRATFSTVFADQLKQEAKQ